MNLKNATVLITGASGGIGEALARAFDREGSKIVLASRKKEKLDAIASGLQNAWVLPTDLTDPDQVTAMVDKTVEHFGRIDILINNAASIIVTNTEDVAPEDLEKAFRTNVIAPSLAIRQSLKYMKEQGSGVIINIGSPGFMMGVPYYAPYACSKAALSAYTRTLQAEFSAKGIFICEFFPGYVKVATRPDSRLGTVEQDLLMAEKQNAISKYFTRPDKPEHIARLVVRLAVKPRILTYSGWGVHLGAYLANLPGFRLKIAKQLAENASNKLKNRTAETK